MVAAFFVLFIKSVLLKFFSLPFGSSVSLLEHLQPCLPDCVSPGLPHWPEVGSGGRTACGPPRPTHQKVILTNLVYAVRRASCSCRPFVPQIPFPLAFVAQTLSSKKCTFLQPVGFISLTSLLPSFDDECYHFVVISTKVPGHSASEVGEMCYRYARAERGSGDKGEFKIQETERIVGGLE